ncbi:MAG: hypothetical protein JSW50_00200 [Candidatus Latescibacterota bacterium]|nr:MAG: hypothetical protein JSW50_00200 [Candidatus Latescibacterota bacterium]
MMRIDEMNNGGMLTWVLIVVVLSCGVTGCEKDDPLEPNVTLSGQVTNSSGQTGTVIVEIDYYLRDTTDPQGRFEIQVHRDFFVDSLYAWVDCDGDGRCTHDEPHGFYHGKGDSLRARSFQVRDYDISGLNFDIP